jgi:hypothetical protein
MRNCFMLQKFGEFFYARGLPACLSWYSIWRTARPRADAKIRYARAYYQNNTTYDQFGLNLQLK